MNKQNKKEIFLKGLIKENPLFVTLLGTCPVLNLWHLIICTSHYFFLLAGE